MTKPELKKMVHDVWGEVQANSAKLNACKGPHQFVKDPADPKPFPKHVCTLCGGKVRGDSLYWYNIGLKHGVTKPG